ncbi:MAG: hypothetical protein ACO3FI_05895 [Cyclobacteriaceae bacterium]
MFQRLKRAYETYREYVRVDLAMYGLLILMILIYMIWAALK